MWLGILIALCFSGAGIAAVLYGVFWIVFRRNWLVGLSLILPAGGFLYFFGSFAAPALWIAIMGDPNLSGPSAQAAKLDHEALVQIFSGQIHTGKYYDKSERVWYHYEEHHLPNGTIRGKGGPDVDPARWTWSGQWKVENGRGCTRYEGEFACSDVYFDDKIYQHVVDGVVTSWFFPAEPKVVLEPGSQRLAGDAFHLVIVDMTHQGNLIGAATDSAFRLVFHGGNHAIHTRRGENLESLEITEYGWYRLDLLENVICISGTLDLDGQCFGIWKSGDTYNFVESGLGITLLTNLVAQ